MQNTIISIEPFSAEDQAKAVAAREAGNVSEDAFYDFGVYAETGTCVMCDDCVYIKQCYDNDEYECVEVGF